MTIIRRRKGDAVQHDGETMKIVATPNFDIVTLRDRHGQFLDVPVAELEATAMASETGKSRTAVDEKRLEKVPAYIAAFGPLLDVGRRKGSDVAEAGRKLGISRSAAYQALGRYDLSGTTADLPPPTRPGGRGKPRVADQAEAIIQECLERIILNRRNHSPRLFFKTVKRELAKAGFSVSHTTLTNRLSAVPDHKLRKARGGYSETRRTHEPQKGSHPDVGAPLACIQIDHWKADMEVLDEERGETIGRFWITVAIDVWSRTVWGVHVGLDDPGFTPVGLAMRSGMTRKEPTIARLGLRCDYPVAGKPIEVKADNAGEFTGRSMQASCDHFHIKLTWRPIGAPQYGGHIERLNGTLAQRFKDLPGATGANPRERKALRPEKTAAFTLEDATKHVWMLIDEYHNEPHTGIGMTPLEKFRSHFFGPEGQKRKLPDVYVDDLDFRRQWFSLDERSLQRYGIQIDYLTYYSEAIEHLVRNRKDHGRILVRRNPFDVREIHILHPIRKEWIVLPTRHLGFPAASLWELRNAKREALRRKREPTPQLLAEIIEEQRRHVEEAQKRTKSARRAKARMVHHERMRSDASSRPEPKARRPASPSTPRNPPPGPRPEPDGEDFGTRDEEDFSSILATISEEDVDASLDD